MRIIFITIILCLSINAQAQNKKNEIQIGVPGAYFFDRAPYDLHGIDDVPLPTFIAINHTINDLFIFSVGYNFFWLSGIRGSNYFGRIYKRSFHVLNLTPKWNIILGDKLDLYVLAGLNYRFSGGELFHVRYTYANGIPWEEILGYRAYNDFGISFGTEVKYKFYKRFSFGLGINYTRYFTQVSPNQLSTAMFSGYEF